MNFQWTDCQTLHRCTLKPGVQITTNEYGGGTRSMFATDIGYVLHRDGVMIACVYGTINPDAPGELFHDLELAKAYVETQARVGLALNKLTR